LDPELRLDHLLSEINKRIEVLYDREHTIGHSFFFKVISEDHPLTALRQVFKEEIIPLLQEYFFGDYAKIGLVLGKDFIWNKHPERLKSAFFAEFPGVNIEDYARPVYEINQDVLGDNDLFRKALLHLMRKTANPVSHEPAETPESL
jgi:5-methylcytosine-specific restriction protein B